MPRLEVMILMAAPQPVMVVPLALTPLRPEGLPLLPLLALLARQEVLPLLVRPEVLPLLALLSPPEVLLMLPEVLLQVGLRLQPQVQLLEVQALLPLVQVALQGPLLWVLLQLLGMMTPQAPRNQGLVQQRMRNQVLDHLPVTCPLKKPWLRLGPQQIQQVVIQTQRRRRKQALHQICLILMLLLPWTTQQTQQGQLRLLELQHALQLQQQGIQMLLRVLQLRLQQTLQPQLLQKLNKVPEKACFRVQARRLRSPTRIQILEQQMQVQRVALL